MLCYAMLCYGSCWPTMMMYRYRYSCAHQPGSSAAFCRLALLGLDCSIDLLTTWYTINLLYTVYRAIDYGIYLLIVVYRAIQGESGDVRGTICRLQHSPQEVAPALLVSFSDPK